MLSEELKYPSNFTPEVQNATAELYKGVEKVIPAVEWPFHAPLIHAINKLKNEKNIAFLKKKKEEVEFLREIKLIKETIKTKKEIKSIIDDDIKYHEQNYDRKMKEYTLKFS